MPASNETQTCLEYELRVSPQSRVFAYELPSGTVHHFEVRPPHAYLEVRSVALVETKDRDPFDRLRLVDDDLAYYTQSSTRENYCEYLLPTDRVQLHEETDRIAAVARKLAGRSSASFLLTLTRVLSRVLAFKPGVTNVDSSILSVLEHGSGVCQDFTHLMLAVCRRQGIPARYVSGYLYTGHDGEEHHFASPSEGSVAEEYRGRLAAEPEGSLRGAEAMHAWVDCLLPGGVWQGFDPTNNLLVNQRYIQVHHGRDYADVTPIRGVYHGPAEQYLGVSVHVMRENDAGSMNSSV
jgi:transglutaminase-like putative cysteine protease